MPSALGAVFEAFFDELVKIGQARDPSSPWAAQTVEAPRIKAPNVPAANAPSAPGLMAPKLVMPAARYGRRINYSQPYVAGAPATNPEQGEAQWRITLESVTPETE